MQLVFVLQWVMFALGFGLLAAPLFFALYLEAIGKDFTDRHEVVALRLSVLGGAIWLVWTVWMVVQV